MRNAKNIHNRRKRCASHKRTRKVMNMRIVTRVKIGGDRLFFSIGPMELLEKIEPLLAGGNPDCLSYINELRAIEGSATLVEQIEDLDFDLALETLSELKGKISKTG